ncbi:MAG: hypothetical protein DRN59_02510 [Thaumarchaeota archaeon]|nr:MAG: hypothetical protein DRN59_02510 [Nitrososphaerota archaeon]
MGVVGYRGLTLGALVAVILLVSFLLTYSRPGVGPAFFGGRTIEAEMGYIVRIGGWGIVVDGLRVGKYLRPASCCSLIIYRAGSGSMIVLAELEVINFESEVKEIIKLDDFKLLTARGRSYERIYPCMLTPVPVMNLSGGVVEEAIEYRELPTDLAIASGESVKGHVLFEIPSDEEPRRLIFRVNERIVVSVNLS